MAVNPVIEYKQIIISRIINEPSIVRLIDPGKVEAGEELVYENIFPFNRVPPTEEEMKTYITLKVDIASNYMPNKLFKDVNAVIRIITHQDYMQVDGGRGATRIDLLGQEITDLFLENGFGFGKLELMSSFETSVDYRHPCRVLTFQTQDLRKRECGHE